MSNTIQKFATEFIGRKDDNFYVQQYNIDKYNEKVCQKKLKCYTCHPKKYVKKHTFYSEDIFNFHFDLTNRPLIIITPNKHVETTLDLSKEEVYKMFEIADKFCKDRNIEDYQLITNMGAWKTHGHLHWKLKINEDVCFRMKQDHFKLLKLEKNYAV
tara:strand:+ start:1556 stop:2026 length:471 start_codon:yes stop_codon:yes gene_type:complete